MTTNAPSSLRKILIAVDESALSRRAAETGLQLARDLTAEVALIHVVDPNLAIAPEGGVPPAEILGYLDRDGRALLASIARGAQLPAPPVQLLHQGHPGAQVVQAARDWGADVIVLGTHGRSGLSKLIMGSVAEQVLRHAPCPVLLIRGRE